MPNLAQYARTTTVVSTRIPRFMVHTCDIYRQSSISAFSSGEMADPIYSPFPLYTGVTSHLQGTPEFDNPQLGGLTKQVNEMTSDRWHFLAEQDVVDTDIIVMRTVGHPDYGHAWIVQGNSSMNASAPGRPADAQWFYAKLAPTNSIPTSSKSSGVGVVIRADSLVH